MLTTTKKIILVGDHKQL